MRSVFQIDVQILSYILVKLTLIAKKQLLGKESFLILI